MLNVCELIYLTFAESAKAAFMSNYEKTKETLSSAVSLLCKQEDNSNEFQEPTAHSELLWKISDKLEKLINISKTLTSGWFYYFWRTAHIDI